MGRGTILRIRKGQPKRRDEEKRQQPENKEEGRQPRPAQSWTAELTTALNKPFSTFSFVGS